MGNCRRRTQFRRDTNCQWRLDLSQIWGVGVSRVKLSNYFRLHPRQWFRNTQSLFLTACRRLEKLSFTFHFRHKSFILDDDVKLADCYPTVLNERMWGVKTYSDPPTQLHGINPQDLCPYKLSHQNV